MYTNETFRSMSSLIVLQHLVGIRRSFLLNNLGAVIISNVMLAASLGGVVAAVVCELLQRRAAGGPGLLAFQIFMSVEALHLIINGAFKKNTFDAIKRLDESCPSDVEYCARVASRSRGVAARCALAAAADAFCLWRARAPPAAAAALALAFAAHDSEIGFCSVMMCAVNERLRRAAAPASAQRACTLYRHALLVAAHIKREFNLSILIMLGVTFIVTIIYCLVAFIVDADKRVEVWMFLAWRETRFLYSVWLICTSATNTQVACDKVLHHVSSLLVFDLDPEPTTEGKRTTRRLFQCVNSESPRYVYGSIFSVDLGVLLRILDISINYFLIIVQIYNAYIMEK